MNTNYVEEARWHLQEILKERNLEVDNTLEQLYTLLVICFGCFCSEEDVHNAWAVYMNTLKPDHPCLIEFNELSREKQDLDTPYAQAIHEAWSRWSSK